MENENSSSMRAAAVKRSSWVILILILAFSSQGFAVASRWSEEKANSWYQQQPWLVGSNFIPASAINELEMWQADTFDPQEIDKELGWAQGLGMNTMRVFLHDLLWQQDAAGFKQQNRHLPDHRGQTSHPPHVCAVRFLSGTLFPSSARNIRPFQECTIRVGCRVRERTR